MGDRLGTLGAVGISHIQALLAQPLRPGQACLFLAFTFFSLLSFIYQSMTFFVLGHVILNTTSALYDALYHVFKYYN